MTNLIRTLKRFRSADGGNISVLFGLTLMPMMVASGVAIDYSGASNLRSIAHTEADAAALEVVRAAVKIHTDPANAKKSAADRQSAIDQAASQIMAARKDLAASKIGSRAQGAITLTGSWADSLKTEYQVDARLDYKRYFPSFTGNTSITNVSVASVAKMEVDVVREPSAPKIDNPGYEAGDYNRIYAYCYDHSKRNDANKGRTQMTPVSSNGTDGSKKEIEENAAFKNVKMPACKTGETLSWRLYNVRDQRTTKNSWPNDKYDKDTSLWTQTDKSGVTIYNHYSDTQYDKDTGAEKYAFTGDAFGFNQPIAMMETLICDTQDECTPGKPTSKTPSGGGRKPTQSPLACSPGKFMFIGWEDRPFLPKDSTQNDYTSANSHQWTDSDYDDIRLVISCPDVKIASYKTRIWLTK